MYLYSQTGQLREVADALTAPLVARGWDIRWVDVQPRVAFPFPWPIRRFFGVFPAAVDPEALVELVEPAGGFDTEPEELVILAYQVWYLAPSLPIRSLLKAHPEAVRNRRVVSLIACRNMWYSAAIEVSGLLRSAGARRVEVVAATDTRRQSTTLVTTLRWSCSTAARTFLWFGGGPGSATPNSLGPPVWGDASPSRDSVRKPRRPSCPPLLRRISWPARCFVGVGRDGQVGAAIRRAGARRELGNVRARLGNRHRGRYAADRMRGTRRRRAVRHGGTWFRASPDLVRRAGIPRGGDRYDSREEEAGMSTFTDQMYGNAETSARGLVTGPPDTPWRRSWGEVHHQARRIAGSLANAGNRHRLPPSRCSPATRPTSPRSPRRCGCAAPP